MKCFRKLWLRLNLLTKDVDSDRLSGAVETQNFASLLSLAIKLDVL